MLLSEDGAERARKLIGFRPWYLETCRDFIASPRGDCTKCGAKDGIIFSGVTHTAVFENWNVKYQFLCISCGREL